MRVSGGPWYGVGVVEAVKFPFIRNSINIFDGEASRGSTAGRRVKDS